MKYLLFPFSIIYGLITFIRNKMFDLNILKSKSFDIPIICVGNITVGGTGKTPHTEFLIKWLKEKNNIAVLSRGYKRKTDGFLEVKTTSTVLDVGDEPLQMKKKYNDIIVAVDRDRVNGVMQLQKTEHIPNIILLDDAYQHRHIKAGLNILLIDYNKPIYKDFMLPVGRLREYASNKKRADIIITTKSPENITLEECNQKQKKLKLQKHQSIFFTTFRYKKLVSLFNIEDCLELSSLNGYTALVITAIANPKPIYDKLKSENINVQKIVFSDHHTFIPKDVEKIKSIFGKIISDRKIIICTEKDAVKLREINTCKNKKIPIYYLPIEVEFLQNGEVEFKNIVKHFISNTGK